MAPDFATVAEANMFEVLLPWTIGTTIVTFSALWILIERGVGRLRSLRRVLRVTRFEFDPAANPSVVIEGREMNAFESLTGWRLSKGQTVKLKMSPKELTIAYPKNVSRVPAYRIMAAVPTPSNRGIAIEFKSDWEIPELCLRLSSEEPVVSPDRVQAALDCINVLAVADRASRREKAA